MRVAGTAIRHPAALKSETKSSLSWGLVFLLIYAAVSVGRIQELLPFLAPMRPGLIAGGLALLVWVKASGTWAEKIPTELPTVQSVMILLGLAVITIPVSIWPGNSLRFVFNVYLKTILLFLMVVYWCRSIQDVRRLIWVCCLATAALAVPGVLNGYNVERYQAELVSYDANDLALLFVIVLPFVLYLYSSGGMRGRLVLLAVALLLLYGIVLTQSRGGILALCVVGGLVLWRSRLSPSTKWTTVAVAILVFGVLAGTAWKERIATMLDPQTEYDRTAGGRTEIWKTGIVLLATHPWGVGIDGFVTGEGLYHQGEGKWNAPHNSFLQIAVELGIIGLVVFIRLLAQVMRTLRNVETMARDRVDPPAFVKFVRKASSSVGTPPAAKRGSEDLFRLAEAVEIGLWGFIVGGFFLSQAYSSILYVMLALSLVCVRLVRQQAGEPELGKSDQARKFAARFRAQPLPRL